MLPLDDSFRLQFLNCLFSLWKDVPPNDCAAGGGGVVDIASSHLSQLTLPLLLLHARILHPTTDVPRVTHQWWCAQGHCGSVAISTFIAKLRCAWIRMYNDRQVPVEFLEPAKAS